MSFSIVRVPWHTEKRNCIVLSTMSAQTFEVVDISNKRATGISCRTEIASWRTSVHRSLSSPDRQARIKNAKEKERAVLAPTLIKPSVATLLLITCGLPSGVLVANSFSFVSSFSTSTFSACGSAMVSFPLRDTATK